MSVEAIQDAVDTLLASPNDELSPLLSFIFEDVILEESPSSPTSQATTSRSVSLDHAVKSSEFQAAAMLDILQKSADDREAEIKDICREYACELAGAANAAHHLEVQSKDLSSRLDANSAKLTSLRDEHIERNNKIQSLSACLDNIGDVRRVIDSAVRLLQQCVKAMNYVEDGDLYQAFDALDYMHRNDTILPLRGHVSLLTKQLKESMELKCTLEMNTWLAVARETATKVGTKAIDWARAASRRKDKLAKVRRAILRRLPTLEYSAAAAGMASKVLEIEAEFEHDLEQPWIGNSLDFTPVQHNIYFHEKLGGLEKFKEYYGENRRLQLSSDLAPPANALTKYMEGFGAGSTPDEIVEAYLKQLVGHFIIEYEVAQSLPSLDMVFSASSAWEAAAAGIKATVTLALEASVTVDDILAVKQSVLFACNALDRCSYSTATIRDSLVFAKDMLFQKLTSTLWDDEARKDELASAQDIIPPVVALLKEPLSKAAMFLKGLLTLGEALILLSQHRDRILEIIVADVFYQRMEQVAESIPDLLHWLGIVDRLACEVAKMDAIALNQLSFGEGSGDTEEVLHITSPNSCASLQHAEEAVEEAIIESFEAHLSSVFDQLQSTVDWAPPQMPRTGGIQSVEMSEAITQLKIFLKLVERANIREESAGRMLERAFASIADGFLAALLSPKVYGWNVYGLQRLLADIHALKAVAEKSCAPQHAAKAVEVPQHFCELLAFGKDEELLQKAHIDDESGGDGSAIDPAIAAELLDKYQELPAGAAVSKLKPLSKKAAANLARSFRKLV